MNHLTACLQLAVFGEGRQNQSLHSCLARDKQQVLPCSTVRAQTRSASLEVILAERSRSCHRWHMQCEQEEVYFGLGIQSIMVWAVLWQNHLLVCSSMRLVTHFLVDWGERKMLALSPFLFDPELKSMGWYCPYSG